MRAVGVEPRDGPASRAVRNAGAVGDAGAVDAELGLGVGGDDETGRGGGKRDVDGQALQFGGVDLEPAGRVARGKEVDDGKTGRRDAEALRGAGAELPLALEEDLRRRRGDLEFDDGVSDGPFARGRPGRVVEQGDGTERYHRGDPEGEQQAGKRGTGCRAGGGCRRCRGRLGGDRRVGCDGGLLLCFDGCEGGNAGQLVALRSELGRKLALHEGAEVGPSILRRLSGEQRTELGSKGRRGGKPLRRRLGERPSENHIERRRQMWLRETDGGRLQRADPVEGLELRGCAEEAAACEHFVEQDSDGEEVAPLVGGRTGCLLGRQIGELAFEDAGPRTASPCSGPRNPEVEEFHLAVE